VSPPRDRLAGRGAQASRPAADARPAQPILPPVTEETARLKVKLAEEAWNTRDPDIVVLAYTEDSEWRNRTEFLRGRAEIRAFLVRKWQRELGYRLRKGTVGVHRQPHLRALRVRVARPKRSVVAQPRQRAL
jgi:hypothetical protein